jgi:hypothetical protein
VGAIFLIDDQVVGMDSFGKPETFSKFFKKLLESYALDAIDQYTPQDEGKVLKSQVTDLIKSARSSEIEIRPSVGLGEDLLLESRKLNGFALGFQNGILHQAIFARANSGNSIGKYSKMYGFSIRSRNLR